MVKTLTPVGLNNDALGDEPKDSLDEDIDIEISDDDEKDDDRSGKVGGFRACITLVFQFY